MYKTVKEWRNHQFSSGTTTGEDFRVFLRVAKRELKMQAQAAGYEIHAFTKGHYWLSAVLRHTESGRFAYVSVGDVRFSGQWYNEVLYRSMKDEKDMCGNVNRWCKWDGLVGSLARLAN